MGLASPAACAATALHKPVAGVKGFKDAEVDELRLRIQASYRLTDADLVAWDVLQCRPQTKGAAIFQPAAPRRATGLQVLRQHQSKERKDSASLALHHRSHGQRLPRPLQAVETARMPDALMNKVSPSEVLTLQLDRLKKSSRKIAAKSIRT